MIVQYHQLKRLHYLDEVLEKIIIELKTPVLAIAGNHDSPGRLNFGSGIMREKGYILLVKSRKTLNLSFYR